MFRSLLRRLRRIRYYSASRHETAWTRAMDVALFATLLLAVPAAFLTTVVVQRAGSVFQAHGALGRLPDGRFAAQLGDVDAGEVVAEGRPVGNFSLRLVQQRGGWPATARIETAPLEIIIDLYVESKIRKNPELAEDDPVRRAIEAALAQGDQEELLVAWRLGTPEPSHRTLGWFALVLTWWVLLWATSSVVIQVSRYLWRVRRARLAAAEFDRVSTGRCARCGYDTRGLDYRERCPECGEILV